MELFVVVIVALILLIGVLKLWNWWTHGRIKARGVRTVGRVLGMKSESGPVSLATGGYGAVTVHTMSYEFDVEGRGSGPFNKVVDGRMANNRADDEIIVYYLPDNPLKHTVTNETP